MSLSLDTLTMLRECLQAQQLNVGDPKFPDTAPKVVKALEELAEEIAAAEVPGAPADSS